MGGSFDSDFKNSGNFGNLENNIILNGDKLKDKVEADLDISPMTIFRHSFGYNG